MEMEKCLKAETPMRENFLSSLDRERDIVLVGKGPTLTRRVSRQLLKEQLGDTISDEFYICCINDSWVFCDEWDFMLAPDEHAVVHFLQNDCTKNKTCITHTHPARWMKTSDQIRTTPYNVLKEKDHRNQMLCLFQSIKHNLPGLMRIKMFNGGQTALVFWAKLGFKRVFLIGFGGSGYSRLIAEGKHSIPLAKFFDEKAQQIIDKRRQNQIQFNATPIFEQWYKGAIKEYNLDATFVTLKDS